MAITALQAQKELRRRAAVVELRRRETIAEPQVETFDEIGREAIAAGISPEDVRAGVTATGIRSVPIPQEPTPPEKPTLPPREFQSTIDEFVRALGRGSLNVGSGLLAQFAEIGQGSIFDVEKIDELAVKAREISQKPKFQPGTDGGVKGFVANAVGDALPFMAGTIAATIVGGPAAGFGVAYSVEGKNAYFDALETGATQEQAEIEGFVVGSINAALELLQVERIIKFAKAGKGSLKSIARAAKDKALKRIGKATAKLGKEAVKLSITEGVQEALQETTSVLAPGITGRELASAKEAAKRIGQAALGGAVVGPILGGAGAVTQAITREAEPAARGVTMPAEPTAVVAPAAEAAVVRPEAEIARPEAIVKPEIERKPLPVKEVIAKKDLAEVAKVAPIPGTKKKFDTVTVPEGENKVKFFLEGEKVHEIAVDSAEEAQQSLATHQTILEEKGEVAEIEKPKFMPEHKRVSTGVLIVESDIGEIHIPEVELTGKFGEDLERVFAFGNFQGDIEQPKLERSLSVGDTIKYRDHTLMIMPFGWRDVTGLSEDAIKAIQESPNALPTAAEWRAAEKRLREQRKVSPEIEVAPAIVKPEDEIAKQVLRDKIARARTEKSRVELQRRLDKLEGKAPPPLRPPISKPTKEEQRVIDAKKFNADIKAHQAQVKGEAGTIDTEEVDNIEEPLGRAMTAEWYEKNEKVYSKTITEKASDIAKRTLKGIDKTIGVTSTRLNKISPELFRRTRRHEFNVKTRTTEQTKRIEPFLKATKKLNKKTLRQLDLAFKNSDGKKIQEIAAKNGMTTELAEVRKVLDELFNAGNAVGLEIDYRKNYMPRVVKDTKGFLEFFQKGDDWSIVRSAIEDKESARGRILSQTERAAVVNTLLRGYRTSALTLTAPGAAKARMVDEIDAKLNQFYADFRTSLTGYVRTMNEKISAREFFGRQSREITKLRAQQSAIQTRLNKLAKRQGRQKPADADKEIRIGFFTGTLTEHISRAKDKWDEVNERLERLSADDLTDTVGNFVIDLVTNEKIKPSQEKEVRDLLMGVFDPQGTHGLVGDVIALTYIDVLGSPLNAITQLEELGLSFYRAPLGFIPEAVKATLNLSEITTQDIGITSIGEEFFDADFKKALSAILGVTGFEKIDRTGKQTFINTVINKMRKQARRPDKALKDRLRRVFGDDFTQVLAELRSGAVTDNIKYLAFNQLLDIQPVAISEMPERYNRAGNMRILFTLKTFMIKQLDFVRNEAFADMKSTDTFMRGLGRLTWLAFSLAMFGAGADALKDFLRGRPFDLADSVIDTFLRRIFFSKFQFEKAMSQGLGRAFLQGFVPPTKAIDAITKDLKNLWKDPSKAGDIARSVPIVGELYYWWFGRGREKALKEQKKAKRDKERRKPLVTGSQIEFKVKR